MSDLGAHWDEIYGRVPRTQLSWYQEKLSVDAQWCLSSDQAWNGFLDVGAGVSTLAEAMLDRGYSDITLLDVSQKALDLSKEGLDVLPGGEEVQYICKNLLDWEPMRAYGIWHDRAMFHFLTDPSDQLRYREVLCDAVPSGGDFILSLFAPDGPERCSELDVRRADFSALEALFSEAFALRSRSVKAHITPANVRQRYVHFFYVRK